MVRITAQAFHEKLNIPEHELILNGPPSDLRGKLFVSNQQTEVLKIRSLPMMQGSATTTAYAKAGELQLSCKLQPGEKCMTDVFHQLDPFTAPGTYESTLTVGGKEQKVKMVVQPEINIDIYPNSFTFLGTEPGQSHTAEFTLTNMGNVDFQIPEVKHVAALDMDLLCRAFGMAMRGKGERGYEQILNEISHNIQSHLPDWARSEIKEQGQVIRPGQVTTVHLTIQVPANCDPTKDYNGNMRFWDKDIAYTLKSHSLKTKLS
jgi:hypothetical protein